MYRKSISGLALANLVTPPAIRYTGRASLDTPAKTASFSVFLFSFVVLPSTTVPDQTRFGVLARLREELPTHEPPPDLTGAGANLVQLGVTEQTAGRIIIDIAIPTQALDGLQRHPGSLLRGIEDGPCGVFAGGLPTGACLRNGIYVRTAGVHGGVHVRQLALHELELTYWLSKLLSLMDVGQDYVHAGIHYPQWSRSQYRAFVVQATHEDVCTTPYTAKHILLRYFTVLENQLTGISTPHAQLVQLLRSREPFEVLLHDERGDTFRSGPNISLGVDDEGPVSYTHLRAHETDSYLVCRLLLEKKKNNKKITEKLDT